MPVQKRTPAATPEQVVSARGDRTQEAVAKLLEVSVNTIQNWEHGRAPVPHLAYKELLATRPDDAAVKQICAEMREGLIWSLTYDPRKEKAKEPPCPTV